MILDNLCADASDAPFLHTLNSFVGDNHQEVFCCYKGMRPPSLMFDLRYSFSSSFYC